MIRLGKVSVLSHPKKHTLEHTHTKRQKSGWVESLVSLLTFPQAPYRVSFLMSTQCIKTCPPQNKDLL